MRYPRPASRTACVFPGNPCRGRTPDRRHESRPRGNTHRGSPWPCNRCSSVWLSPHPGQVCPVPEGWQRWRQSRGLFLGLGLEHRPQPVAVAIEHLRHGAGRGQSLFGKTQGAQLLDGFSRGQAGVSQGWCGRSDRSGNGSAPVRAEPRPPRGGAPPSAYCHSMPLAHPSRGFPCAAHAVPALRYDGSSQTPPLLGPRIALAILHGHGCLK